MLPNASSVTARFATFTEVAVLVFSARLAGFGVAVTAVGASFTFVRFSVNATLASGVAPTAASFTCTVTL